MWVKFFLTIGILFHGVNVNAMTCGETYKAYLLAVQRAGNIEEVRQYWSKLREMSWEHYLNSLDDTTKREKFVKQYFLNLDSHAKKAKLEKLPKCISINDSFKVRVDMRHTNRKEAIIGELIWEDDRYVISRDIFYSR